MEFGDENLKFVFSEVGDIRQQFLGVAVHGLARENPAHVRPEAAVARRVRITVFVRVLMMDTMRGDPRDGAAFKGERAADRQEIFHPFRRLVTAMREQAMVAHTNAETARNPPKNDGESKSLPAEEEKRGDGADMKRKHKKGGRPVDWLGERLVAGKWVHVGQRSMRCEALL